MVCTVHLDACFSVASTFSSLMNAKELMQLKVDALSSRAVAYSTAVNAREQRRSTASMEVNWAIWSVVSLVAPVCASQIGRSAMTTPWVKRDGVITKRAMKCTTLLYMSLEHSPAHRVPSSRKTMKSCGIEGYSLQGPSCTTCPFPQCYKHSDINSTCHQQGEMSSPSRGQSLPKACAKLPR